MARLTKEEMLTDAVLAERRGELPAAEPREGWYRGLRCSYKAPNGNRCLIGRHLPEGHPAYSLKAGVRCLLEDHRDLAGLFPDDVGWLEKLQNCHDNACEVQNGTVAFNRGRFYYFLSVDFPEYAHVIEAARELPL